MTCQIAALSILLLAGGCASGGGAFDGGAAGGCAGACTDGATACLSSTTLQTCAVATSGCANIASHICGAGLVCEHNAAADCVDPTWAEWRMPNLQADVADGAPNLQSITDDGEGTVTDQVTGLTWQQAVASTLYAWSDAVAFCPTLILAGHTDWRLPSAIELVSIVDYGQSSPSIDGTYFPSTPTAAFWSSSFGPTYAWKVDFTEGSTATADVTATYNVRCVR